MDGAATPQVILVQPSIPIYRIGFFERLSRRVGPSFTVYASTEDMGVLTERGNISSWERGLGPIRHPLPGLSWQSGALSVPVRRGDVIVVCGAPRMISTLALVLKGKVMGARIVWWGHYWSSTSRPWRAAIRFALMRLPDAIVFYTDQEVSEYHAANVGKPRKPVFALNNGIDTTDIMRLRAPYCANQRPRDLLFIGRITDKAQLEMLIEALAASACRDVTLDIVGDGDCEEALRQRCDALGIRERIIWHGGMTDEHKIAAIANRCKLFVYPGAVGLGLIHALAYGLPAIVHDNRWAHMPEIAALRARKNGFVFAEGDVASLASVVEQALTDHARLAVMSGAAIETTARTFNTEDMADRFCAAIDSLQYDMPVWTENADL